MKELLMFAWTTEGRKLSEYLAEAEINHTVCVATEYGEIVLRKHPCIKVRQGRMNQEQIGEFLSSGKILLTVGSKELSAYCASETIRHRLYARVLPSVESLSLCAEQGLYGKQVIAMQGPFTAQMNEAVIRQYEITCLVTKESGLPGGYQEKTDAAKRTGAKLFVIGCPNEEEGYSFSEICQKLEQIEGERFQAKHLIKENMEIILAGIGMGHENCLTKEAERKIREADFLLGAHRMLQTVRSKAEKHFFIRRHKGD